MKKYLLPLLCCLALVVSASPLEDLMPRPKQITTPTAGTWTYQAQQIKESLTSFETLPELHDKAGAYRLTVTPTGVLIEAETPLGLRYGKTTLEQLRNLSPKTPLPCATIVDYPTYPIRGILHDTGRNWQPIQALQTQIDQLANYKMNVFQWHITDNHGWRLASAAYPQLSQPANLDRTDNFYTTAQFKALIAYAAARGVMVIPEFDVPGHTQCFRRAFGIKRMDEPQVRDIITKLLDEASNLLDPAVTPYIHIGSDEVQAHEHVPEEWLVGWIELLRNKGFKVIAWGPGLKPKNLKEPLIRQYWMGRQVKRPTDEPYIDSQHSNYINHVDPEELLTANCFQKPCITGVTENQLGEIFAVWHDDAVKTPQDVFTMNPVYPALVLYADSAWNGRPEDKLEFYGNLPDPASPYFALPVELERCLLAQKPLFKGLPFVYYPQTQYRWRLAESTEALPFDQLPWKERILPQATTYVQHFFYRETNLVNGKIPTVWLGMIVVSDRDKDVPFIADCMNYSRSDGRTRDAKLVQGKWNAKGADILLNGKSLPPPHWDSPGKGGREIPMTNEAWAVRKPQKIHLKRGENQLLIKLPKGGWKWSATCIFPDLTGLTFLPPPLTK